MIGNNDFDRVIKSYVSIINKKINLEFHGKVVNSYTIKSITPTNNFMVGEYNGRMYEAHVDWSNKAHTVPVMEFDAKTLDDLERDGFSQCSFAPMMFKIVK